MHPLFQLSDDGLYDQGQQKSRQKRKREFQRKREKVEKQSKPYEKGQ